MQSGAYADQSACKAAVFEVVRPGEPPRFIQPGGHPEWALRQLIVQGPAGVTPKTHPGPRWSAYVHDLRHTFGLDIETVREPHAGPYPGHHGRYVLRERVIELEGHIDD